MKRLFAGGLLLCAACAVAAEAPRKIVSLEGVTEYQLANGLRLLTLPDPGIDTSTVHITYLVGSRHEGYGEKGMAHLLEHLLFKGSGRHPNVKEEFTRRGARWNGTTSMDPALAEDYLAITWELRRAGIPTELYIGTAKRLGKQLEYADQYEIPLAILYGTNEKSQGVVTVKDMSVGREKTKAVGDRKEWLAAR